MRLGVCYDQLPSLHRSMLNATADDDVPAIEPDGEVAGDALSVADARANLRRLVGWMRWAAAAAAVRHPGRWATCVKDRWRPWWCELVRAAVAADAAAATGAVGVAGFGELHEAEALIVVPPPPQMPPAAAPPAPPAAGRRGRGRERGRGRFGGRGGGR